MPTGVPGARPQQRQYRDWSLIYLGAGFDKLARFLLETFPLLICPVCHANLLGDLHRAEFWPAHGTEMGGLRALMWKGFIVIFPCAIRIEAQVELIFPAELETRLRKCVVAKLSTWPSFGEIGCMSGDFVGNDSIAYVVFIRKPQMLLGG